MPLHVLVLYEIVPLLRANVYVGGVSDGAMIHDMPHW